MMSGVSSFVLNASGEVIADYGSTDSEKDHEVKHAGGIARSRTRCSSPTSVDSSDREMEIRTVPKRSFETRHPRRRYPPSRSSRAARPPPRRELKRRRSPLHPERKFSLQRRSGKHSLTQTTSHTLTTKPHTHAHTTHTHMHTGWLMVGNTICRYYQSRRSCKWGDGCRFLHVKRHSLRPEKRSTQSVSEGALSKALVQLAREGKVDAAAAIVASVAQIEKE